MCKVANIRAHTATFHSGTAHSSTSGSTYSNWICCSPYKTAPLPPSGFPVGLEKQGDPWTPPQSPLRSSWILLSIAESLFSFLPLQAFIYTQRIFPHKLQGDLSWGKRGLKATRKLKVLFFFMKSRLVILPVLKALKYNESICAVLGETMKLFQKKVGVL